MKKYFPIILLATMMMGACQDDLNKGTQKEEGYLYFTFLFNNTDQNRWIDSEKTGGTRAEAPIELTSSIDLDEPLYLHCDIENLIDMPAPVSETRGVRFTQPAFNAGPYGVPTFGIYAKVGDHVALPYTTVLDRNSWFNSGTDAGSLETNPQYRIREDQEIEGYWGEDDMGFFYGFAPAPLPATLPEGKTRADFAPGIQVGDNASGVPTMTYTMPADETDHHDVMMAKDDDLGFGISKEVKNDQGVKLNFHHVLSAVRFKTKSDNDLTCKLNNVTYYIQVKSIAVNNVYAKGSCPIVKQVTTPSTFWTKLKENDSDPDYQKGSCTVNITRDRSTILDDTDADYRFINTDENCLMMLPQTTPTGATVVMTCDLTLNADGTGDKKENVTFTAAINGKEWHPGYYYNYTLSSDNVDYVFTHTGNTASDTYLYTTSNYSSGEEFTNLQFNSYKYDSKGNQATVKWTAAYSNNDGASYIPGLPDWVHIYDNDNAEVTYDPHNGALTTDAARVFRLVVDPFKMRDMDLSLYSIDKKARIKRTTANSYIVTNPGTYRIPLVYGNGFKNGALNEGSYKVASSFSSILSYLPTFKNSRNGNISSLYIATDMSAYNFDEGEGEGHASASIVWQDVENLVTNPQVEWVNTKENTDDDVVYNGKTYGYLKFTVEQSNMNYGNAVLAVKDGYGTIVWSWHIWVNDPSRFLAIGDYSVYGKSTTRDGVTYTFAGHDMGWIDPASVTLPSREIKIRLTQAESGKVLDFTVHQDNLSFTATYRNIFYQWGRKDPFPGNTPDNTNITVYNGSFSASMVPSGGVGLDDCIKNPGVQYVNTTGRYLNGTWRNLWNMNSTSTLSTTTFHGKTIYDPCPIGYRVPPSGAYQNFNVGASTPLLQDGILSAKLGSHFYLPIVGYRDGEHDSGAHPVEWQRLSYYWQATALSGAEANMVRIRYYPVTNNIVGDDTHRGDMNRGCNLRPVKEPDSDVEIIENNPFSLKTTDGVRPEESLVKGNNW